MSEKSLSVKERLAILETLTRESNKRSDERWDAHDKRSDDNWKEVRKTLDSINTFNLGEGDRKTVCMKEARGYTHKAISWTLGIPATICAIIGAFVMVHRLFGKGPGP
jgi:ferric-dicitrate binding protein FerR (iron transport regulator)